MDEDEVIDLGQGALFIGDIAIADLSNLEAIIVQAEYDGETGEIEIQTTK